MTSYDKVMARLSDEIGRPYFVSINGDKPDTPIFMKDWYSKSPQTAFLVSGKGDAFHVYRAVVKLHDGKEYVQGPALGKFMLEKGERLSIDSLREEVYHCRNDLPPPDNSHGLPPEAVKAALEAEASGETKVRKTRRSSVLKAMGKQKESNPVA